MSDQVVFAVSWKDEEGEFHFVIRNTRDNALISAAETVGQWNTGRKGEGNRFERVALAEDAAERVYPLDDPEAYRGNLIARWDGPRGAYVEVTEQSVWDN